MPTSAEALLLLLLLLFLSFFLLKIVFHIASLRT
jgi:hypothetical protein